MITCKSGKCCYESREFARKIHQQYCKSKKVKSQLGKFYAYRCHLCSNWHLTSQSPRKNRILRKRRAKERAKARAAATKVTIEPKI